MNPNHALVPRDKFGQFMNPNKPLKSPRLFDDALRRAIAQDDGKRLRDAAEKLLTEASRGKPWALAMLADRLDGKVLPMLPDVGDGQLVVTWIASPSAQPVTLEHEQQAQLARPDLHQVDKIAQP
jgi:hypothetical protein